MTQYRRLLEQAHGASAAQLHALQAELRILRGELENERAKIHEREMERDNLLVQRKLGSGHASGGKAEEEFDLATVLRGMGNGKFDEVEVRKAVKTLKMNDRVKLYVCAHSVYYVLTCIYLLWRRLAIILECTSFRHFQIPAIAPET